MKPALTLVITMYLILPHSPLKGLLLEAYEQDNTEDNERERESVRVVAQY